MLPHLLIFNFHFSHYLLLSILTAAIFSSSQTAALSSLINTKSIFACAVFHNLHAVSNLEYWRSLNIIFLCSFFAAHSIWGPRVRCLPNVYIPTSTAHPLDTGPWPHMVWGQRLALPVCLTGALNLGCPVGLALEAILFLGLFNSDRRPNSVSAPCSEHHLGR